MSILVAMIVGAVLLMVGGVALSIWAVCVLEARQDKRLASWMQKMEEDE